MKALILAALAALPYSLMAGALDGKPAPTAFDLHNGLIFVKASIGNSEPLDMLLDSGSAHTTLDEAVARKLGLDLSMKARSTGVNGIEEISVLKDQTLRSSGVEVAEPLVVSYPLDFLAKRLGHRVDGIIGVEIFRKYVIEIDYAGRSLRIVEPGAFSGAGAGESVPVTYQGRLALVAGSVTPFGRAPIETRFLLDTGAAAANVAFWKDFVEKHDLASGVHALADVQATGFGGSHPAKEGRAQAIRIGGITIADPMIRLNDVSYGEASVYSGNLGASFFTRFKVIFDLPHDRLILISKP
jgi:hypothetical protein